jgi:hypothetical protein
MLYTKHTEAHFIFTSEHQPAIPSLAQFICTNQDPLVLGSNMFTQVWLIAQTAAEVLLLGYYDQVWDCLFYPLS